MIKRISQVPFMVILLLTAGCGASSSPPSSATETGPYALKLRHQILFTHGEQDNVFEGYMILQKDAFLVKAFAGPGVDLFTVARDGERHNEVLHISALQDRIDIAKVGADINRTYLVDCEDKSPGNHSCLVGGEEVTVTRGPDGRIIKKEFPAAHGVGLNVIYEEPIEVGNRKMAKRITLTWGEGKNRMVILTVASEILTGTATDSIENALHTK